MAISWIDFSIAELIKPFSISLEKNDFLFLAGETYSDMLLRSLAGFLPEESNSQDSIRINGQRMKNNEILKSVLLPKNAAQSLPLHRTVGAFALDLSPDANKKKIENHAAGHGIERHILYSKPSKISPPDLQKISLWLCSLSASMAIFIEEPDGGFFEECRPFDFLQKLLRNGITSYIVYSTRNKDTVLQKARALQFCRARIAVFCADRLVEEGDAVKILENPIHPYTKEWLNLGLNEQNQIKNGALWQYCLPNCPELQNCPAKQSVSSVMWDCESPGLHKVLCRGFLD